MKYAVTGAMLLLACSIERGALAQGAYPRVYGPTGRLYGPTQAHYQYERQYGQRWHGQNGLRGGVGTGYVNGYPGGAGRHYHAGSYCYGGGAWYAPPIDLYPVYGGYYGNFGYAPTWPLLNPTASQVPADHQAILNEWLQDERRQWTSPLESLPVEQLPKRFVKRSTDAARARSARLQHEGDLHFQNLEYDAAGRDYKDALLAAQDRPDPYFRLGFVELTRGDFSEAALNFKLGLQLEPTYPQTGTQLEVLMSERNLFPKTQLKQRVLDWVQQDIRDPDRLFVLGVVLHFDNDSERAAVLFETAARLGGMKQHLQAFLTQPAVTEQVAAPVGAGGVVPPPPQPPQDAAETVPEETVEPATPAPPAVPGPRTSVPRRSGPVLPEPADLVPPPAPT